MEDIDHRIVALLAQDGRMSFTDLGKETGLSTSAVHQRVRRLEQRGVIRGYRAIIDPEALGLSLTAFVSIKAFDASAEDQAPKKIARIKGVEACYSVAGDEAYILKVRVASPVALEALLSEIRAIAGVSTRTTVVLSVPFEDRRRSSSAPLALASWDPRRHGGPTTAGPPRAGCGSGRSSGSCASGRSGRRTRCRCGSSWSTPRSRGPGRRCAPRAPSACRRTGTSHTIRGVANPGR